MRKERRKASLLEIVLLLILDIIVGYLYLFEIF